MRYDFDTPIDRRNTFSFKWDCDMDYFGRDDVIPMWVADMDFACAPCIVEAVQKRAAHPVYGYGVRQQPYYDAVMGWLKKRYGFEVNYEHLAFAPPGVIYAMNVVLRILTKPGDKVITDKYAGTKVTLEDVEYIIVKQADILAIVELKIRCLF